MTSTEVASHYNAVRQDGLEDRKKSKIFHLRNLNNWMKSQLINEGMAELRKSGVRDVRVMDVACGKGGDLKKWQIARVKSLVMIDIADVSVDQAKERYEEMKGRSRGELFPVQFIKTDCCKSDVSTLIDPSHLPLNLVSCQFALHYSFCDILSARHFIRNVCSCLSPGGIFLATLPDADTIVWSARQSEGKEEWKNRVCRVTFNEGSNMEDPPLFGSTFHFELDEQVNCPEFLAYFPLVKSMLEDEGMEMIFHRSFPQALQDYIADNEARRLLERMNALKYVKGDKKEDEEEEEWAHLEEEMRKNGVGSVSKSEWEAFSMYVMFAFRKKKEEGEEKKTEEEKEEEGDKKEGKEDEGDGKGKEVDQKKEEVDQKKEEVDQKKDEGEGEGVKEEVQEVKESEV